MLDPSYPKEPTMARILVVAPTAGGDLPPLVALAEALRASGHDLIAVADSAAGGALAAIGATVQPLPAGLDLGPWIATAIRDGMAQGGGDLAVAGQFVQQALADWADGTAGPISAAVAEQRPDAVVTSLFGVEAVDRTASGRPWAVVNSTFYLGPDAPRPAEADIAPRALPLLMRYAGLLDAPDLVLHATDRVFDLDFTPPDRHHYVGPLGIWERPDLPEPEFLDEPGDPWVLVTISSQLQDDVPLAEQAMAAVAGMPVRALVTTGPEQPDGVLADPPPNVRVVRTASHAAVLRRAAALLGHAGHGSVLKAIWHGVPMVLAPWGRDQPGVAYRAVRLGVAEAVPRDEVTPDRLAAAVERVLADRAMREQAGRHGARLRAEDHPAKAAALIGSLA
jgi:UDP:flavonoid glycosyltransferase YjiC (YdhE family)